MGMILNSIKKLNRLIMYKVHPHSSSFCTEDSFIQIKIKLILMGNLVSIPNILFMLDICNCMIFFHLVFIYDI